MVAQNGPLYFSKDDNIKRLKSNWWWAQLMLNPNYNTNVKIYQKFNKKAVKLEY